MNEQLEHPAHQGASAQSPGGWLRAEREKQGRTVQQVAADLHLGTNIIEAIEANRFAVLGAPVFARGHLRNYANLLGLPIERAHELYEALTDRPRDQDPVPVIHRGGEPSIPMTPDSKERDVNAPRTRLIVGAILAVLALVAAGVWWWLTSNDQAENAAPISVPLEGASAPTPVEPSDSATLAAAPATSSGEQRIAVSTVPAQTADPVVPQPTRTPALRAPMRLSLSFSDQSWVEVYDVRGTRRLYDVGEAGQTRTVQVEPPAQLVLGNAPAVSIEANGRPVAVPERVANQVARFTLRADGTIQ